MADAFRTMKATRISGPTGLAAALIIAAGSLAHAQEQRLEAEELEEITLDTSPGDPGELPEPAADQGTPEERLQRYFRLYKEALDNNAYTEADTLAKQVVELSIALFGVNSLDSARALTNLGIAQHQNEDYDS